MFASGKLMETFPLPVASMLSLTPISDAKPISNALIREPGRWVPDPIPNNMLDKEGELSEAAKYEARQCNKDPGIGYRRCIVQFDGYRAADRTLIDAKYWTPDGKMVKFISRLYMTERGARAFEDVLDTAERQLIAADGMQIE